MRERLARFMVGRNGNDQLNMFLMVVGLLLLLLSSFIKSVSGLLLSLALAVICWMYYRMFSRNLYKRREENGKYIRMKYKLDASLRLRRERWIQRKEYKFFTCPSCRTSLRVPRRRGKVKIVCRKCGTSFFGKT